MSEVRVVLLVVVLAMFVGLAVPVSAQLQPPTSVRTCPPGWVPGGAPSGDARTLYLEAMAAYNRYQHALARHSPNSPQLQQAQLDFTKALEAYYIKGLGWVRAKPQPTATPATPVPMPTNTPAAVQSAIPLVDRLVVETPCAQPFEVELNRLLHGSGYTTQVEVVIHGFVYDHEGNTVAGATVRLKGIGARAVSDSRGHYQLIFKHQGYSDVDFPFDIQLDKCCLWVDPAEVNLGAVPPGGTAQARVSLVNTCDTVEIDVSFPHYSGSGAQVQAKIADCSAGYQGSGVAYGTGGTLITMGPGSRCWIDLFFEPPAPGTTTTQVEFTGSDCRRCPVTVKASGSAAQMLRLGATTVDYPGVAKRFMPNTRRLAVSNASPHSPLTITSVRVEGPDAGDFLARIDSVSLGQVAPAADSASLLPGATAQVAVDMVAGSAGAKQATLVLTTSDPNAPLVRIPINALVE